MSAALIPVREEPIAVPGQVVATVEHYLRQARASNTWRAYRADWEHFQKWCAGRELTSLPADPGTVAFYLAEHADSLKIATLQRRLCAINKVHTLTTCLEDGFRPCAKRIGELPLLTTTALRPIIRTLTISSVLGVLIRTRFEPVKCERTIYTFLIPLWTILTKCPAPNAGKRQQQAVTSCPE